MKLFQGAKVTPVPAPAPATTTATGATSPPMPTMNTPQNDSANQVQVPTLQVPKGLFTMLSMSRKKAPVDLPSSPTSVVSSPPPPPPSYNLSSLLSTSLVRHTPHTPVSSELQSSPTPNTQSPTDLQLQHQLELYSKFHPQLPHPQQLSVKSYDWENGSMSGKTSNDLPFYSDTRGGGGGEGGSIDYFDRNDRNDRNEVMGCGPINRDNNFSSRDWNERDSMDLSYSSMNTYSNSNNCRGYSSDLSGNTTSCLNRNINNISSVDLFDMNSRNNNSNNNSYSNSSNDMYNRNRNMNDINSNTNSYDKNSNDSHTNKMKNSSWNSSDDRMGDRSKVKDLSDSIDRNDHISIGNKKETFNCNDISRSMSFLSVGLHAPSMDDTYLQPTQDFPQHDRVSTVQYSTVQYSTVQ